MGFLFPDPPKQPQMPNTPPTSQHAPVPPELQHLYTADQIVHGMADAAAQAEAIRRANIAATNRPGRK